MLQHSQVHSPLGSEHHVSNLPTDDTQQLAPLPHSEPWRDLPYRNAESDRRSMGHPHKKTSTDDNTPENGDHLRTLIRKPGPLPSAMSPLRPKFSPVSFAPTTIPERSLMFAIASDDAKSVHHVLEHGYVDPNEAMGPQSALAFALTNERLAHKLDIVKALLAYGADPSALRNPELNPPHRDISAGEDPMLLSPPPTTTLEVMDPAIR